jgi:hypothetical protein
MVSFGASGVSLAADPSLCALVHDGTPVLDQPVGVSIMLGSGDPVIVGGQFAVRYDPAVLAYDGVSAGTVCDAASPFARIVWLELDEANGELLFSVMVPFGQSGTQGPATMACLDFVVVSQAASDVCLIDELPFDTFLLREGGGAVTPDNANDCPAEPPALACGHVPEPSLGECDNMDSDGDGDIDLHDFAVFQRCFDPP